MSSGDPYLNGPRFLEAEAKRASEEVKQKVHKMNRQQLMNRGDVLRVISSDDFAKVLRKIANFHYNETIKRLLDPAQRKEGETTEGLRAEAAAHKVYVDTFDLLEKEGKEALKKLKEIPTDGDTE